MKIALGTRRCFLFFPFVLCSLSACQQRMAVQPSFKPLDPSSFFPDGRSSRPVVVGTVARGNLWTDLHLFTGKRMREPAFGVLRPLAILGATEPNVLGSVAAAVVELSNDVDTFPFPVTRAVLDKGQTRYQVFCVVCHDPLGTGRGKIVERGYTRPPSYHIDRLRQAPVGHFFDVITNGYGSMPDYKQQIPPRDRWAIAAYLRALQLSQHYPVAELTADMRAERDRLLSAAPTGGQPR